MWLLDATLLLAALAGALYSASQLVVLSTFPLHVRMIDAPQHAAMGFWEGSFLACMLASSAVTIRLLRRIATRAAERDHRD